MDDIPETNVIPLYPGMLVESKWPAYHAKRGEMGCVNRLGQVDTIWLPCPLFVIAVFAPQDLHGEELNVLCLAGNGCVGWIHSGWVEPI